MLLGRVQTRSADNAGEAWVETEKTWYEISRFVEVIGVLHVRAVDVSVHLVVVPRSSFRFPKRAIVCVAYYVQLLESMRT